MLSERLPDELVLEIVQFVDIWTFHQLRRCSNQLRDLLIPVHPVVSYRKYYHVSNYVSCIRGAAKCYDPAGKSPVSIIVSDAFATTHVWRVELQCEGVVWMIEIFQGHWTIYFSHGSGSFYRTQERHFWSTTSPRKIDNPSWARLLALVRDWWFLDPSRQPDFSGHRSV